MGRPVSSLKSDCSRREIGTAGQQGGDKACRHGRCIGWCRSDESVNGGEQSHGTPCARVENGRREFW
ncbi:MAG: hypothetical protein LBJ41_08700, partial [Treponema sp.]|nr:hypothetical protein [Treponema sp.]